MVSGGPSEVCAGRGVGGVGEGERNMIGLVNRDLFSGSIHISPTLGVHASSQLS